MCQIKRAGTRIFSAYRLFGAYAYTLIILLLYVGVNIAKNNDLSERINSGLSEIDIRYNSETGSPEWSPRGADTWSPFKKSLKILKVGYAKDKFYSNTFDVTRLLPNVYTELTSDNFFFKNIKVIGDRSGGAVWETQSSISYNPNTGIVTATAAGKLSGGVQTTFSGFGYYEIWAAYVE